jgi:cytochrome c oxidase assembly factor CtaG
VLTAWQPDPLLLPPLVAIGAAYVVGYRRLSARRRRADVAMTRGMVFGAGYCVLLVALVSPLHTLGEDLFSAHMVQHLLLTHVAAPLLLAANSMPVVLWALPERDRAAVGRWIGHERLIRGPLKLLTHPAIAWSLYLASQWLWHQPTAYQWALANRWVHYAEHLTFFGAAVLFWWPVVGAAPLGSPLSYPARILYAFLAWIPNSILGAGIALSPSVLYSHYAERARLMGVDAQSDQVLAGLIMWIPGDLLFLGILLLLLVAFLRQEERAAERIDRELDMYELAARSGAYDGR